MPMSSPKKKFKAGKIIFYSFGAFTLVVSAVTLTKPCGDNNCFARVRNCEGAKWTCLVLESNIDQYPTGTVHNFCIEANPYWYILDRRRKEFKNYGK